MAATIMIQMGHKAAIAPSAAPVATSGTPILYTARHSFASHYINTPNATVGGLATLLARTPNNIATYIHSLTRNEDVIQMTKDMPI